MKNLRSISHAVWGAVVLLVALQGCGDDDNDAPPTDATPTAGTKSTGGTGGKSGNDNAAGSDEGGTGNTGNDGTGNTGNTGTGNRNGNTGGGEQVGGQGGGGNPPAPVCELPPLGEDGCFNCPEDGEQGQWLNRCADGDCVDFDDSKLVKLGGDPDAPLPALPN